jgi:hypothetical protein
MAKLSNSTARKHFLHDCDMHDGVTRCCFFSERAYDESGWGFWVRPCGTVDVDNVSSNGLLPSTRIVQACVRAAVRHLTRK